MLSVIAVILPLLTVRALRSSWGRESSRGLVLTAAGLSLLCSLANTGLDPLSRVAMVLYSILVLVVVVAAPKRDATADNHANYMWCMAGTLMAYASDNLLLFLAGWAVSAVPYWDKRKRANWTPASAGVVLAIGTASLALAIGIMAWQASSAGVADVLSISTLRGLRVIDNYSVFGLLVIAFLARKGMVPFRSWLIAECEKGSLLKTVLFVNGHLGAYVVARLAMPLAPLTQQQAVGHLSTLGLLVAAYASLAALTELSPRRILGLLSISHVSFVLVGLESGSEVGVTGALVYLAVLGLTTTLLFVVIRALEVRLDESLSLDVFYGLGSRAPRLAVFFLTGSVALVGMPGTLGFIAEDLLFHGTIGSLPELGFIMPVATAFNAVTLFRMFSRLFFGRPARSVPAIPDALPRERWALTGCVVLLVVLGLQPDILFRAADRPPPTARASSRGPDSPQAALAGSGGHEGRDGDGRGSHVLASMAQGQSHLP